MEVRTDSIWFYCDRHHSLLLKKERLTPITEASQTTTNTNRTAKPNRVRYAVYGTQYPVSTIRYMVLSPAAHRGKSSTTAKKWREIKELEGLWSSLQIHP